MRLRRMIDNIKETTRSDFYSVRIRQLADHRIYGQVCSYQTTRASATFVTEVMPMFSQCSADGNL